MNGKGFHNELKILNPIIKLGFFTLVIGIILIVLGKTSFFGYISCYELGLWFGSLSLAIIALGYALDSDKKMNAVANANFMEIYENIQNDFLNIKPKISSSKPSNNLLRTTFIWKYRNSLMRANTLKDFADEINQLNLVLPLQSILEYMPWDKNILTNKDVEDLLDCYLSTRELKFDNKIKESLEKLIEQYIVKRKENEDIVQCVEKKIEDLSKKPNDVFKK
jgi:hypothetical protein